MINLYVLPVDEVRGLTSEYCACRFPKRTAEAERFVRAEDRLRSLGAGALLSHVLHVKETDLTTGTFGKPTVKNGTVSFNLSHGKDYVLLGVDDAPIGVDIEWLDPSHFPLAKKVFTADERQWMASDPLARFFTLWTLKESVLKCLGTGLSRSPESFSVLPLVDGDAITLDGQTLFAKTTVYHDHILSVCTTHPFDLPTIISVTAREMLQANDDNLL